MFGRSTPDAQFPFTMYDGGFLYRKGLVVKYSELDEFYKAYIEGVDHRQIYMLNERGNPLQFPLYFDIDILFDDASPNAVPSPGDIDKFNKLVIKKIRSVLHTYLELDDRVHSLRSTIGVSKITSKFKQGMHMKKLGMHYHFPWIYVNAFVALALRTLIIRGITRDVSFMRSLPFVPSNWNDVFDQAVYHTIQLRVPWSYKLDPCRCKAKGLSCGHFKTKRKKGRRGYQVIDRVYTSGTAFDESGNMDEEQTRKYAEDKALFIRHVSLHALTRPVRDEAKQKNSDDPALFDPALNVTFKEQHRGNHEFCDLIDRNVYVPNANRIAWMAEHDGFLMHFVRKHGQQHMVGKDPSARRIRTRHQLSGDMDVAMFHDLEDDETILRKLNEPDIPERDYDRRLFRIDQAIDLDELLHKMLNERIVNAISKRVAAKDEIHQEQEEEARERMQTDEENHDEELAMELMRTIIESRDFPKTSGALSGSAMRHIQYSLDDEGEGKDQDDTTEDTSEEAIAPMGLNMLPGSLGQGGRAKTRAKKKKKRRKPVSSTYSLSTTNHVCYIKGDQHNNNAYIVVNPLQIMFRCHCSNGTRRWNGMACKNSQIAYDLSPREAAVIFASMNKSSMFARGTGNSAKTPVERARDMLQKQRQERMQTHRVHKFINPDEQFVERAILSKERTSRETRKILHTVNSVQMHVHQQTCRHPHLEQPEPVATQKRHKTTDGGQGRRGLDMNQMFSM